MNAKRDRPLGGLKGPTLVSVILHIVLGVAVLAWFSAAPDSSPGEMTVPTPRIPVSVALAAPAPEAPEAGVVEEPTAELPPPPPAEMKPEEERAPTIAPEPVLEDIAEPTPPEPPRMEEREEEPVEEPVEVPQPEPAPREIPAPEPPPVVAQPTPPPPRMEPPEVALPETTVEPTRPIVPPVEEEPAPTRDSLIRNPEVAAQLQQDARDLMEERRLIETRRTAEDSNRFRERLLATSGIESENLRTFPRVVCTYSNLLDRLLMLERLECQLVALHPERPDWVWTIDPRSGQAQRQPRNSIDLSRWSPRVIDPIAQGHGHEFFRDLVSRLAAAERVPLGETRLEGLLPVEQDRIIAFKQRWVMQQMGIEAASVWATRGHFVYTRQGVAVFVIDALIMRDGEERPVTVSDPELNFLGAV